MCVMLLRYNFLSQHQPQALHVFPGAVPLRVFRHDQFFHQGIPTDLLGELLFGDRPEGSVHFAQ